MLAAILTSVHDVCVLQQGPAGDLEELLHKRIAMGGKILKTSDLCTHVWPLLSLPEKTIVLYMVVCLYRYLLLWFSQLGFRHLNSGLPLGSVCSPASSLPPI